jgi:hypothetical protein
MTRSALFSARVLCQSKIIDGSWFGIRNENPKQFLDLLLRRRRLDTIPEFRDEAKIQIVDPSPRNDLTSRDIL